MGGGGGVVVAYFLFAVWLFNHPKEWREDVKRSDGEGMNDWGIQSVQPRPICPNSLQTSPETYLKMPSIIQSVNCQSISQSFFFIATCQVKIPYTWNESWC